VPLVRVQRVLSMTQVRVNSAYIDVGTALRRKGAAAVMEALHRGPLRHKDLLEAVRQKGLEERALDRALEALEAANLVRRVPTQGEKQGLEARELTIIGRKMKDLLAVMENERSKDHARDAIESLNAVTMGGDASPSIHVRDENRRRRFTSAT